MASSILASLLSLLDGSISVTQYLRESDKRYLHLIEILITDSKKPIEFETKLCFDHSPISCRKRAEVFSFVVLVAEDYRFRGKRRIRSSEVPQKNVYYSLDCFSYRR